MLHLVGNSPQLEISFLTIQLAGVVNENQNSYTGCIVEEKV